MRAPARRRDKRGHPQALGRSRGGLSTEVHLAVDRRGRPLSLLVTPGQAGDAPQGLPLLEKVPVPRTGRGHPRTRPARVILTRPTRREPSGHTCGAGASLTIPEPADQTGHRHRRGARGGRPHSIPFAADSATSSNAGQLHPRPHPSPIQKGSPTSTDTDTNTSAASCTTPHMLREQHG